MMQQMFLGQGPSGVSIEDVFSTDLYTGNNSTQSINNGLDLSGEGGLVWIKERYAASNHLWFDTQRGGSNYMIKSNSTAAQITNASSNQSLTSFNSNGFSLGPNYFRENFNNGNYVAYSFRRAEKFFNIVTYTGNGANRSIPHGLGSQPGMVIIKRLNGTSSWIVWHKEQYESSSPGTYRYFMFNNSAAGAYGVITGVDSTNVGVVNNSTVNSSGSSYVMYVFAADTDNLIKTGIYTGNGSTQTINVGFQPQWVLAKNASSTTNWTLIDSTRGTNKLLIPNSTSSEFTTTNYYTGFTSNGFSLSTNSNVNGSALQYAYMAIAAP